MSKEFEDGLKVVVEARNRALSEEQRRQAAREAAHQKYDQAWTDFRHRVLIPAFTDIQISLQAKQFECHLQVDANGKSVGLAIVGPGRKTRQVTVQEQGPPNNEVELLAGSGTSKMLTMGDVTPKVLENYVLASVKELYAGS